MSWILYSIFSSILWGLNYSIGERVIKNIGISTLLLFDAIIGLLFAIGYILYSQSIKDELYALSNKDIILICLTVVCNIVGSFLLCLSIKEKNATMAGLIEITYPFFTALFSYIIFSDNQLSLKSFFGGFLIMLGTYFIWR